MSVKASDKFWGVIPSAGSGVRFGGSIPKQYQALLGATVLEHSLRSLLNNKRISGVVIAVSKDDPHWQGLGIDDPGVFQTVGGETRADSVLNGLNALQLHADQNDWVLVHDAVRPCLNQKCLDRLLDASVNAHHGAILAVPSVDTVKQSNTTLDIINTLPRDQIWLAQTPQMFRLGVLRDALSRTIQQGQGGGITDEASAIEQCGLRPRLVPGSLSNIKITHPEDLDLAAHYLQSRQDDV